MKTLLAGAQILKLEKLVQMSVSFRCAGMTMDTNAPKTSEVFCQAFFTTTSFFQLLFDNKKEIHLQFTSLFADSALVIITFFFVTPSKKPFEKMKFVATLAAPFGGEVRALYSACAGMSLASGEPRSSSLAR
jgi:hypothetical protein